MAVRAQRPEVSSVKNSASDMQKGWPGRIDCPHSLCIQKSYGISNSNNILF